MHLAIVGNLVPPALTPQKAALRQYRQIKNCWMPDMLKRLLLSFIFAGLSSSAFAETGGLFGDMFGHHSTFGVRATASGHLLITIDISEQQMVVEDDSHTIFTWDVSTGRPGHATPRGSFRPVRMNEMWYSSKYENAPMPWSIFFHGGYAIHGTTDLRHLGHVASHGCVRLDPKNAKLLYDLVNEVGMGNVKISLVS
jgi:L,D-transpeptidase catalytic domain